MKVVFAADRRSEIQVLGGVLHELQRRGHDLVGMQGWMIPKAQDDVVTSAQLLAEWPGTILVRELMPTKGRFLASAGVPIGDLIPTIMVDYCWDLLFQSRQDGVTLAYATELQRRMVGIEGPVVGSPALAYLPSLSSTDFVFFMPKLRRSRAIIWLLAWAARRFAHRRGLRLVGITRRKHGRSGVPFMDAWASVDGAYWPPPVQRALQTAAFALHCQSGAQFECLAAGVPTFCVTWPITPGLSGTIAGHIAWKRWAILPSRSWTEVVRSLLHDDDRARRWNEGFQERYLGPHDAHQRVADLCEV